MLDDKLKNHMHLEKLKELEQTMPPEELHCLQRRYHRQKSVVSARSRDNYVQEAATPVPRVHREVAMMWRTEEQRYGDGGLLCGVVLARSHPSSNFILLPPAGAAVR